MVGASRAVIVWRSSKTLPEFQDVEVGLNVKLSCLSICFSRTYEYLVFIGGGSHFQLHPSQPP